MRQQAQTIDLEEFERRLRAPEPARRSDDPLAELARLLGTTGDPFRGMIPPQAQIPAVPATEQAPQLTAPAPEMHPDHAPQMLRHVAEQMRYAQGEGAAYDPQAHESMQSVAVQPQMHGQWDEQATATAPAPHHQQDHSQDQWHPEAQQAQAETVAAQGYDAHGYDERAAHAPSMPLPPPPGLSAHAGHDGERRALSRKSILYMGSALAVVVVGVGATLATSGKMKGPGSVPTITASKDPVKVKPEGEGASPDKPVRNVSILDKPGTAKPAQANAVSREEQPVDLTQVQAQPRPGQRVPDNELNRIVDLNNRDIGKPVATVAPQGASAPQASGYFPEPRRVRTVAVRPDGSVVVAPPPAPVPAAPSMAAANAARPPVPAVATPQPAAPRAAAPEKTNARAGRGPASAEIARNGNEEPDAAPVASTRQPPAARPAPEKPKPATTAAQPQRVAAVQPTPTPRATPAPAAASAGGGFAVQLAAPPTDAEAQATASRLRQRFGAELGGRSPTVKAATVGDKTVYRVRIGGLSREDATALCAKLQGKGGACFVARN